MRSPSSFSFINWLLRRFRPSAMTEKIAGNGEDVILEGSQAKKPKLSEETTNGTVDRSRKRKVALFVSYIGRGYNGMQRNPGVKSIEGDLIVALWKAGAITEECRDRLDKMMMKDNIIEEVNSHLPAQIRAVGFVRTTKKFDCKLSCSARSYEYLLPTFAFAPCYEKTRRDFRISDDILSRVQTLFNKFKGTHRFHNFTARIRPSDPAAQRYILEFNCGKPFERLGMEFLVLRVKGQSFMLHQIRKMVGMVITVAQGLAGEDIIQRAWGGDRVDVPKAPALGLLLDRPYFEAYNKRFGSDGSHDRVDVSDYESSVEEFKQRIYDTITETEAKENSMMHWLSTLSRHDFVGDRNEAVKEAAKRKQDCEQKTEESTEKKGPETVNNREQSEVRKSS